jgi:hypothetical protein
MHIYLVGSLKDDNFPMVADALRAAGHEVFDDWRGAGCDGDARWREYELNERERGYVEALRAPFASNGREFDRKNIDDSDVVIAVCKPNKLPGASSVAEMAYARWHKGKYAIVLLNGEPNEWELMLPLAATHVCNNLDEVLEVLRGSN